MMRYLRAIATTALASFVLTAQALPDASFTFSVDIENRTKHDVELNAKHATQYSSFFEASEDSIYDHIDNATIAKGGTLTVADLEHYSDSDDTWHIALKNEDGYFQSEIVECNLSNEEAASMRHTRLVLNADGKTFDIIAPNHTCQGLELHRTSSAS